MTGRESTGGSGRFRGQNRSARSGHFNRQRYTAHGRCIESASVGFACQCAGVALDAESRGYALVFIHEAVPPAGEGVQAFEQVMMQLQHLRQSG